MTIRDALSVGQQALWFIYNSAPSDAAYNIAFAVRVHTRMDSTTLARAVRETASRHDILRSVFVDTTDGPRRVVGDSNLFPFEVHEVPDVGVEDLAVLVRREVARPFDLRRTGAARVTLLRRAPDDAVLVLVGHHIVLDFSSEGLILRDLLDAYAAFSCGQAPDWTPPTYSWADFVAAESQLLDSPRADELAAFWRSACADTPTALNLGERRSATRRLGGASHVFLLPDDVVTSLLPAARACLVMPHKYMFGVFQSLLYRYCGQSDFLVGCVASTRPREVADGVVGPFVNLMPIRARLDPATTFREVVREAHQRISRGVAHAAYPFALVPKALGLPSAPGGQPLVRVMVSLMSVPPADPLLVLSARGHGHEIGHAGLRLSGFDVPQQEGQFDLALELTRGVGSVRCVLKYDLDLFDRESIRRMGEHFVLLLRAAVADPDRRVAQVPLTDDDERARLLAFGHYPGGTGAPVA
jgi:hypothetical protein